MEALICIQDCDSIDSLLSPNTKIKKGEVIQDYYQEGPKISSDPFTITYPSINTYIIRRNGFYLSYDSKYFMKLSEYRSSKIDKIHE